MAIQAAAVHPDNQPNSGDKPVKNNDKAIKGDLGPNDQPVKPVPTTTTNNNNTDKNGVKSGVNILCHGVM